MACIYLNENYVAKLDHPYQYFHSHQQYEPLAYYHEFMHSYPTNLISNLGVFNEIESDVNMHNVTMSYKHMFIC